MEKKFRERKEIRYLKDFIELTNLEIEMKKDMD